ncbi:DivIVA domain-containing protein [Sinomonas notoginsengisoli]|uniref:DivIVA domain-containing protein n=1 Tax=Sinomonas notoginsengisoli TaxID=1457311 RepID=UPI003555FE73
MRGRVHVAHTEDSAAAGFDRVGRGDLGYSPKQVEKFLSAARAYLEDPSVPTVTSHQVRTVSFDAVRGGYDANEVDAALDRLEDAFARRERDDLIQRSGEDAWLREIGQLAGVLRGRLVRPDGERFRRPSSQKAPSYHVQDVDSLCVRLLEYLEHGSPLRADEVRTAVFRTVSGPEGYEETQVDAFLDRVVELMAAID